MKEYADGKEIAKLRVEVARLDAVVASNRALMDERERVSQVALDKASTVLNQRLDTMNEFRAQINMERATYVNKDELALILKPLQERMNYNKGRDATVYAFVAIGISALVLIVELLKLLVGR